MSTSEEIATVVDTNTLFSSPCLTKKALLNAPWFPESPPKKPLKKPPTGRCFLSKYRFFIWGVKSIIAKIISKIEIKNLTNITSIFLSKK